MEWPSRHMLGRALPTEGKRVPEEEKAGARSGEGRIPGREEAAEVLAGSKKALPNWGVKL